MGKGMLEVTLIDAKGLLDTDAIGDVDPYVLIQYRNQEKKSSVARSQGRNPLWNETFEFTVHNSSAAEHHQKLILRIIDKDTFTADDFIGEATISVADVISLGMEEGFSEVRPCKYRVVLPDRSYYGEIRVGVTFRREQEVDGGGRKQMLHS